MKHQEFRYLILLLLINKKLNVILIMLLKYNNIYALLIKTKCFEIISNIIFIKQLNTAILIYSINKLITFSSTLRKCIIFLANKKWKIQIINQLNEPITLHLSK